MALEVVRIEELVRESGGHLGRPPLSRKPVARAFMAKSVLNIPTTVDLVERLDVDGRVRRICGFTANVPSEPSFSRMFREFSESGVLDKALERGVKFHLGQDVVFHVSHDSTAIPAREHSLRKRKEAPAPKRKRERRPKNVPAPLKPQEVQEAQSWQESLAAFPTACDFGVKIGSMGFPSYWRGYKAHASISDCGVPLAFFTTSASMSDSLGAIPLMKAVKERVGQVFYNLFDRGYPGESILRTAQALDQVAIVAPKKSNNGQPAAQLTPDRAKRFENRTVVERFMSDLKCNHGGSFVFVRGHPKVHAHLMFGVLSIFALRMLRI